MVPPPPPSKTLSLQRSQQRRQFTNLAVALQAPLPPEPRALEPLRLLRHPPRLPARLQARLPRHRRPLRRFRLRLPRCPHRASRRHLSQLPLQFPQALPPRPRLPSRSPPWVRLLQLQPAKLLLLLILQLLSHLVRLYQNRLCPPPNLLPHLLLHVSRLLLLRSSPRPHLLRLLLGHLLHLLMLHVSLPPQHLLKMTFLLFLPQLRPPQQPLEILPRQNNLPRLRLTKWVLTIRVSLLCLLHCLCLLVAPFQRLPLLFPRYSRPFCRSMLDVSVILLFRSRLSLRKPIPLLCHLNPCPIP